MMLTKLNCHMWKSETGSLSWTMHILMHPGEDFIYHTNWEKFSLDSDFFLIKKVSGVFQRLSDVWEHNRLSSEADMRIQLVYIKLEMK